MTPPLLRVHFGRSISFQRVTPLRLSSRQNFFLYALGVGLTLVVALAQALGVLVPLDRWLYDVRASNFQFFTPEPTDKLVHIDIDDNSIAVVGRWPWSRTVTAELLDELHRAGAGPVAIDLIFGEPSRPEIVRDPSSLDDTDAPTSAPSFQTIDHDARLTDAIARYGNVILPASFALDSPVPAPEFFAQMVDVFVKDLELDDDALVAQVAARATLPTGADVTRWAPRALREAMRRRITDYLDTTGATNNPADLPAPHNLKDVDQDAPAARRVLLPMATRARLKTDADRVFDRVWPDVLWERELQRGLVALPAGAGVPLRAERVDPTVPTIARAAAGFGSVAFLKGSDGIARNVPLIVQTGNHVLPQLALVLACRTLGVETNQIELRRDAVVLPCPDGRRIVIPVRQIASPDVGRVDYFLDLPVWGTRDWQTMYEPRDERKARHAVVTQDDTPATKQPSDARQTSSAQYTAGAQQTSVAQRGHWPAVKVWEISDTARSIRSNASSALAAMEHLLRTQDTRLKLELQNTPPALDDVPAVVAWIGRALRAMSPDDLAFIQPYVNGKSDARDLDDVSRQVVDAVSVLQRHATELPKLHAALDERRAVLRSVVEGKSILIGWAATGEVDFYPTAIHAYCPGVVLHGVVFNGVMTGELWRALPNWVSVVVGLGVGLIMTLGIAKLSSGVWGALAFVLGAGFALVDALLLFDYANLLLDAAAPLVTVGVVWALGSSVRLAIEATQRQRLTRLFSSYVDPQLVDHFIQRPDQVRLRGEVRELTVVFTDLADFTSQMERLGASTVPLLNEYMSHMVPVVRRYGGYLNKFLGDGLMFFFGAPRPSATHARDAILTVLDMYKELDTLNVTLVERGLPKLEMRAGISTGPMVVGDAGSDDACDYTVLGDAVNLGARLESANKHLGTCVLMSADTARQVESDVLLRPVGRLKIIGREEPVDCFEPLTRTADATDTHRAVARCSALIVQAFAASRLQDCLTHCDALQQTGDASRLSDVYRAQVKQRMNHAPDTAFDGTLVLTSK